MLSESFTSIKEKIISLDLEGICKPVSLFVFHRVFASKFYGALNVLCSISQPEMLDWNFNTIG